MRSVLTAAALLPVVSAYGGVFGMLPDNAQLVHVDEATGEVLNVGSPLADLGFTLEKCAPAVIEDEGKTYFTLMRFKNDTATAPFKLVGLNMFDATVQYQKELDSSFSPSLRACDHGLTVHRKGKVGSHVFVSAATGPKNDKNLTVVHAILTGGADPATAENGCSSKLSDLGMGEALDYFLTDFAANDEVKVLWHQLEGGLVGCNVTSGQFEQQLPKTADEHFSPMFFTKWDKRIYGLARQADGTRIASFDPVHGSEFDFQLQPTVVPTPEKQGTAAVVIMTPQSMAIQVNTTLVTVDLNDGSTMHSVQVCKEEIAPGLGCFASMAYLPSLLSVSV